MTDIKVGEIMSPNPICCTPDTPVPDIAQQMEEHDCGAIPVVDQYGAPKGIVTDRDLAIRVIAEHKPADQLKASQVMTPATITVTPETPAREAAKLMASKRLRRLLVVDESGKCAGVLALADLARACPAEYMGSLVKKISEPTARASEV